MSAKEEQRLAVSRRVAKRDGYDWRCTQCVQTAQECLNGSMECPYRLSRKDREWIDAAWERYKESFPKIIVE